MLWVILTCVVVSSAFIVVIFQTWDVWLALNAAGVVVLLYLIGLTHRAVRPPVSQKMRRLTIAVSIVVLAGVTGSWVTSFFVSGFQGPALHLIRKVIFHGVMVDALYAPALETLAEFHGQAAPEALSIGVIFQKNNPPLQPSGTLLDTLDGEGDSVHLVANADSSIILIGQSSSIDGEDQDFGNFDGSLGKTQDRLRLTARGIWIEIQN